MTGSAGSAPGGGTAVENDLRRSLRLVHRAASELRRGVPVVLTGPFPLLLLCAETAGPEAVAELQVLSGTPPFMLLAPARAAAILRAPMQADIEVAAVALPESLLRSTAFRTLPDPTARQDLSQPLQPAPVPAGD